MSYEPGDKILFSGDAFGSFGALNGGIFDDEAESIGYDLEDEILRYFSNIVGMYSSSVQSALGKLEGVDVEMVAPTHGPIWRTNPEKVIEIYDKWSSLESEPGVTLLYGFMYGNTKDMMEAVAEGVSSSGCRDIKVLDASRNHPSFLLSEAWRRKGLIVGAPTYDARIFPPVDQFLKIAKRKKLRDRIAGVFGSYGLSGGAAKRMKSFAEDRDWELVEPVADFRGNPSGEELNRGRELGKAVGEKVQE